MKLANAGHPHPLLLRKGGAVEEVLVGADGSGPALGMIPDERYQSVTVPLKPGDRVFVFTDGLYEAADATGEEFGHQRLQQALSDQAGKATPLLLDSVLETVRAFGTSETATGFADDICVMGVDFGPRGSCPTWRRRRCGGVVCARRRRGGQSFVTLSSTTNRDVKPVASCGGGGGVCPRDCGTGSTRCTDAEFAGW